MIRAQRFGRIAATVLLWVLSVLMTLAMLVVGLPKVKGISPWPEYFEAWGYAEWFRLLIGTLQAAGGVALLVPRLARYAAALLIISFVGESEVVPFIYFQF